MSELKLSTNKTVNAIRHHEITARRVRAMQRKVKRHWAWSARALAERLGISRAHLKRIESGSRRPTEMFCIRFRNLENEYAEFVRQHRTPDKEVVRILSAHPLPARFEILAKPVKCPVCKWHFVPRTPRQKFCGKRCARQFAAQSKKRKEVKP